MSEQRFLTWVVAAALTLPLILLLFEVYIL
jgi:hypothetical protein